MGAFVSRASQTTMGVLVLLAIGGVGVYVLFSAAERRATSAIGSLVTNAPQIASSVADSAVAARAERHVNRWFISPWCGTGCH